MAVKTYKFRIYPSKRQQRKLDEWLKLSCELYNAALQERRDAWVLNRVNISYKDQNRQLTEIKEIRTELQAVNSQVLQDALRRLDKSFKGFFRRVKSGQSPGFPRFKAARRFRSFSVPKTRYKIADGKLDLSRFGKIKLRQDCVIVGEMTNLTVSREIDHWFACITVKFEPEKLPKSTEKIGVDLGYRYFAVLSDGTFIDNPRFYKEAQKKLRVAARRVARRKKGSRRREKAVALLAKVHEKIRRSRADFQHKLSRRLVNQYGFLAVEDLAIREMTKTDDAKYLNKSLYDAAWGNFLYKLEYKAVNAGRELVKVNPAFTAQTCICGAGLVKKPRQATVNCTSCGRADDCGIISANVILQNAVRHSAQALTREH